MYIVARNGNLIVPIHNPLLHCTTIACIDVLVLFLLLLKVCKDCIHACDGREPRNVHTWVSMLYS